MIMISMTIIMMTNDDDVDDYDDDKQGQSQIHGRTTEWPLMPGGGLKAGSSDDVGKEEGFDFAQRPHGWAVVEMRTLCQRPLPLGP